MTSKPSSGSAGCTPAPYEPGRTLPTEVIDGLLEGYQLIGFDFTYLYVNNAVAAHGRKSKEELLGHKMHEVYPGIEETHLFTEISTCLRDRTPRTMENEFLYDDGSSAWFELRMEPVSMGVVILSMDITERKEAEQRLLSTNRALSALSGCNQAIVRASSEKEIHTEVCRILVEEGGFVSCCLALWGDGRAMGEPLLQCAAQDEALAPLMTQLMGALLKELPSSLAHNHDHLLTETEALLNAPLRALLATGSARAVLAAPVTIDKAFKGLLLIAGAERDAFDGSARDLIREITADIGYGIGTLRIRRELKQKDQRLSALIATSPAAIFTIDVAGHILYWNESAERIFGWSAGEVVGRPAPMVGPSKQAEFQLLRDRVLRGEILSAIEVERVTKGGAPIWLSLSAAPLYDAHDRITGIMTVMQDVSARRGLEQEIVRSERRYKTLVDNLEDVVFSMDTSGNILFMSPAVQRVYGFSPEQMQGTHFSKYILPEDLPKVMDSFHRELAGAVESLEFRIHDASGEIRYLRSQSRLRREGGVATAIDGVIIDFTSLHQANEETISLNHSLAILAKVTNELSRVSTMREILDIVPRTARELTGAQSALFVMREGAACHFMAEAADSPLWRGFTIPLAECFSGTCITSGHMVAESDILLSEGTPLTHYKDTFVRGLLSIPIGTVPLGAISLHWTTPHTASGDEVRLLKALADATSISLENLMAVEDLRTSRSKLISIYKHLPIPTFVWQRDNDLFTLSDYNEEGKRLLAPYFDDPMGLSMIDWERFIPGLTESLLSCNEESPVLREEVVRSQSEGGPVACYLTTYGHIPENMIVLHVEDITTQRETEEQLRLSQRLEALGQLAGGVAHDFNNLLSLILNYTELALEELPPHLPVVTDLSQVLEAGRKAAALTRQLLAFSRKQILVPKIVSLNEIVSGLHGMLRRLIGEHINIHVRLDPELGSVRADPGQLEQILINLAVNARDAMPGGGSLFIETSNTILDNSLGGQSESISTKPFICLSVTDTGEGMSDDVMEHIFEPFYTTKELGHGTGLGLSTVYGIVRQSGGNIWVYSEKGEGSTFKVYLPEVFESPTGLTAESERGISRGDESILLAEDDEGMRTLIARLLDDAGYHVTATGSGQEAILACQESGCHFDLLITDVVMPHMGGAELAEHIRRCCPGIPVLFTSGYSDSSLNAAHTFDARSGFIGKPFTAAILTSRARELLDIATTAPI